MSGKWVSIKKYKKPDSLFKGQLGRIEGVTFIETRVPKHVIKNWRLVSQWDKDRHGDEIWDQLIAEDLYYNPAGESKRKVS
jgi:hypothetical protein